MMLRRFLPVRTPSPSLGRSRNLLDYKSGTSWLHPNPRRLNAVKILVLEAYYYSNALNKPSLDISFPKSLRVTLMGQSREHSGHSHGKGGHHHHHHDSAYLTSTNKSDAGVRITKIGLYVNLLMAVGKGLGGWYFHSHAL